MTDEAQIEVERSDHGGIPVLRVRGEIDVASAPQFRAPVLDLMSQPSDTLIVDMSDVTFIDSTGLGVLLDAEKRSRAAGKSLRLVVTQPHVRRLLELTGLDEVLNVVASASEPTR